MPGPHGEERRASDELLRLVMERFDRMEDRADARFDELANEIKITRHGGREALTMVTEQLVETVRTVALHGQRLEAQGLAITELERRTSDDGPIDKRFRRHDTRLVTVERAQATSGRFTWADVAKVIGALTAAGSLVAMFVTLVLSVAPHG